MNYTQLTSLSDPNFQRFTGIKRAIFDKMLEIVRIAIKSDITLKNCRPRKLSIENQLFLTIMYYREYRTYFHTGISFGISEATAYRTVTRIEYILSDHPDLQLPEKQSLQNETTEFEVVLIDATESPVERPTENQEDFYSGKKKDILKKLK